jgi:hypothetical protein
MPAAWDKMGGVGIFVHRVHPRSILKGARKSSDAFSTCRMPPIRALLFRRYAFLRSGVTFSSALDGSQYAAHASISARRFSKASDRR